MTIDLNQLTPENITRIVIDLNAQRLAQIDPALPELMRACAIPVAFNAELVSQLISVSASQPDSAAAGQPSASQLDAATALSHLLTLPFIIQRQDGNYTYHDNSRNVMLEDWQNDRPHYMEYVGCLIIYYTEQGNTVYWQENYATALTWFNHALELANNHSELTDLCGHLYNWRGNTQVRLGNYTEAVVDLIEAIQHQVANADTYFDLGIAHYYLNNTHAALAANNEAISLNPQEADYFINRGILYKELGQINLAEADYTEAIRLNPQYDKAFRNRDYLYLKQKQFIFDLSDYEQAIQLNPQHAKAYYGRARIWALQGQAESAMRDLRQAFELDKEQKSTKAITLAQTDSDLDNLRELPAFQALLAEFGGATANREKSE